MMNSSSRHSATFSPDSDSTSVYSDHDCRPASGLVGTQAHSLSHSEPATGGLRRENAQNFERTSTVSFSRDLTSRELEEDPDSHQHTSDSCPATYRFETQEEAEERRRRSAVEARPVQHSIRRDTDLDAARTYMQRVLSEHEAATTREESYQDPLEDEDEDIGEYGTQFTVPGRRTSISRKSLASTDSGELGHETDDSAQPETPRQCAVSLSNVPSTLQLDHSSLPGSDVSDHQSAAPSVLNGADGESDALLLRESSGQWLGGTDRHSALAARCQGRADWQESGLFSSSGRQYGRGDLEEGYVAGNYVTVIRDGARPEKGKRRRDAWKRISCL